LRTHAFSGAGLIVLVLFGALFVWLAIDLLLLIFAGILAAIFLRSLSAGLARYAPLSEGWALLVVILLLCGVVVGAGVLVAPGLAAQTQELVDTLPGAVSDIEERVRENPFGNWVLDRTVGSSSRSGTAEGEAVGGMENAQQVVVDQARVLAPRLMDGLIGLVVVLFTAIYLAAHPQPYIRGLLRLFPIPRRHRIGEVLYACGYTLQWWLFGQMLAMALVGITMGVGLAVIGVPLALALGVLAGLFEFIPTLGPMLALLPALVLSLTAGTSTALWVLGLYSVVQTAESYLLTPLVQQRVVHLPPVVTIAGQIFFTWTLGPVGLLIAVPLIAVIMVCVQMLYVEDVLGDDMDVEAAEEGRAAHAEAAPMAEDQADAG
jgi:predicted PurR-regulated permease PerM